MSAMHLVVGLGNPGAKYQHTRHNIGWLVLDELVARGRLGNGRSERRAMTWDGSMAGKRVKLAKPLTYMNRSGESAAALLDYYRVPLERLLVIHDDLDTPFGALKLRRSGGHGGQNGIRSITRHLGSQEFARLRFGIGRPPGRMNPVDYVLQAFSKAEQDDLPRLITRGADAVEAWLRDGIDRAMSDFNGDGMAASQRETPDDLRAKLSIAARARDLAPNDPRPLARLIKLQKQLGLLDAAVDNHLALAALHAAMNQPALAVAEKAKAVAIQPERVDAQLQIADDYLALGNTKKAVARLNILAAHCLERGDIQLARRTIGARLN